MNGFLFLLIAQGILIGMLCSYVAGQKNRSQGNWFFLGFLFSLLALIALAAIPSLSKEKPSSLEPPTGEINIESSKNRRYRGERNIQLGKYQLFLTEKYSIQKNATLEKYVVDENLFETLEHSLLYADGKETQEIKIQQEAALKNAYLISSIAENSNASHSGIMLNDILLEYNGTPITSNQDIADAISSISEPNTSLVVLRGGEKMTIEVKSGRLGIDGSVVALDSNAYEARVKEFEALGSIV